MTPAANVGASERPAMRCAVVGASGYVGGELVRLLLGHPGVSLVAVTARETAGRPLAAVHPHLAGVDMKIGELEDVRDAETVFLALPNGESMNVVGRFADRSIVDLSADFRLRSHDEFAAYYRAKHTCAERIPEFTYGQPELFRSRLREARHIAAPGCFATAVQLALAPVVDRGLAESIVVNAVTGSSGSGARPKEQAHHPFRAEGYFAYSPLTHRHVPEIRQAIADATGRTIDFVFQPHSGPFVRGIFSTAIVRLAASTSTGELEELYRAFYAGERFVRIVDGSPNVKWVRGTNFCDIGIASDGRTAIVTSAIDNLLRGGASQAVQAFNIRNGFDESAGVSSFGANP